MSQEYSDPTRENDPHALPDVEVFELTAAEVAASDAYQDEQWEAMKLPQFRLANMNSRDREKLLDYLIEEHGIRGGWFYWFCFPGCLPDSEPVRPFETREAALADAREGRE